ncbi:MAG: 2'-5' RNA ligase family protein [Gaiellaceae bacterium]
MTRNVLLVPVREVASVVEPWLERTCESKPSHGIPAHVTLLFPCPPPEEPVVEAVRDVLGGVRAFDVDFPRCAGFRERCTWRPSRRRRSRR